MIFYLSGDYAKGRRIEPIPQAGGNLETPRTKADDWQFRANVVSPFQGLDFVTR
jgi:hypothetical protein